MNNKSRKHPLQSACWADFRKNWGNKVLKIKSGYLTIHKLPITKYSIGMFIKGPAPNKELLEELKNLCVKYNLIFIKLEPNLVIDRWNTTDRSGKSQNKNTQHPESINTVLNIVKLLKKNNCVPGKTLFTPTSFWIDLTKSEDDLLISFSGKTRYNIRYAQRKGVRVIEDNSNEAFEKYLTLMRETINRQGFYAHTENYHRLMWKYLHEIPVSKSQKPIARLLTAKYKNEIVTTWIVFTYDKFLYYPYGASSDKYKNVQANSLMMWEAIRFGKKLGLYTFDLWGREPGKGFTKFKEGYDPEVVKFLGTWDLVNKKFLYQIYKTADKFRWFLLKLKSKLNLTNPNF